jgi:hypothetical protein
MDTEVDSNKKIVKKSNTKMYICNTEISKIIQRIFQKYIKKYAL